ncbi:MAG: hypothetical protein ACK4ND_05275 [Cytophagaceae bacterium]
MLNKFFKCIFIFISVCTAAIQATAQSQASENLFKIYNPLQFHGILRYDHYLSSGSFFYLENNVQSAVRPLYGLTFPANTHLNRTVLGYEHAFTENWYGGVSGRYELSPFENFMIGRVNLSHRGKIKSLYFIKELALEHQHTQPQNGRSYPAIGRLSFSAALIKAFKIKEDRHLFVMASFRPTRNFFYTFPNDVFRIRRINSSDLRLDLAYNVTNNLYLGIFALRNTFYSYRLGMTDGAGNPIVEEGRVNRVSPTVGFTVNYVFKPVGVKFILPNLPVR